VDLASYITTLLSDNDTVIIPGFGAFISVYKPAVINENVIIPPGKEIRFFPQVRNNDNLLAMNIARSKKISFDDAFKRIEKATSKIIFQLDKGEKVVFGELGEFSYDENGIIQFTHYQTENPITQIGHEPVSLEDVVETPEEITESKEPAPEETTVEKIPETGFITTDQIINEIAPDENLNTEPVDLQKFKKAVYEENPEVIIEPRKKKNLVWLWVLLVVIIAGAALYFFLTNKKQAPENNNRLSEEIKNEQVLPTTTKPDSIQPVDSSGTSQSPAIVSGTQYHLVGGGFKNEENALKFINQLKNKGIEGKLLGQKGKVFLVGIASYNSEPEAYNELNRRMRENPEWKLWVYEK
jgi:nucleoid DNA-binding protein